MQNKRIKILVISTMGLKQNGITQVIYDYYSRFDKNKFEIVTITSDDADKRIEKKFQESGIRTIIASIRKKSTINYIIDLFKIMKAEKFDAIHVNGNSATMAIELFIGKLLRCKMRISHVHNTTCNAKTMDKVLRPLFYNSYTHAFACGTLAGKWMYKNNTFQIYKNGRDIYKYVYNNATREKIRNELNIQNDELAIGHIGNFNDQKNHKFLIEIFSEIFKEKKNVKLFLAGYGYLEDDIKRMVDDLQLSDNVIFLGLIDNVSDILQAMDIMVLPSLHEGLPLVVIEWQLSGLTCYLSDVITEECVFTNLVKFINLDKDAKYWATKILEINNNDRSNNITEIINASKINKYDINENAKELMQFYLDSLNNNWWIETMK